MEKSNWAQVAFLFILISCSSEPAISFDRASFRVEFAQTPEEKELGLMFRGSLAKDAGMLFVFNDTEPRNFWMKNTEIPLDMISLDENFVVTGVRSNVQPCKNDPCPSYSLAKAHYVLEINAGVAADSQIVRGSRAVLR